MKFEIGDRKFVLKLRSEKLPVEQEKYPATIAEKKLEDITPEEFFSVVDKVQRNLRRKLIGKGQTTATFFKVDENDELVELATTTVHNYHKDPFDANRGRREALDAIKKMLAEQGFTSKELSSLTQTFYTKFPKSRPDRSPVVTYEGLF